MKKLLFAINPHAGKGEIKTKPHEVIDLFVHDGYEVTVHTTQRRREITHLLAGRAALYDLIVCCGGDGTLNEPIDGLMRCTQRPPLGYIP
ncbi:acylglycerol kinase family protein, partial [Anaerotruncus colihominis]|uniref:acylglycerol kinase family protein n=1 Tax=Anaerotruncus colihominis TaxID=169435 RepID=UPI00210A0837